MAGDAAWGAGAPGHTSLIAPIPPTSRSRRLQLCAAVVDSPVCVAVFAGRPGNAVGQCGSNAGSLAALRPGFPGSLASLGFDADQKSHSVGRLFVSLDDFGNASWPKNEKSRLKHRTL